LLAAADERGLLSPFGSSEVVTKSRHLVRRFIFDAQGQDLIEYGLLLGIVTTAIIGIGPTLITSIGNAYNSWGTQTNNLWVPPPPGP
jgi:Flp pilus assembly pilin Flp